ncbi:MAG: ATP synthase subunit C [Chlamydiae bacterium]|nr:ATP synthase subunit C [Chlamydiota bacterium]
MELGFIGPGIVLGLGCIGSSIGCSIAGMASHGVMTHVEEGHGKFIGLSALPSSQSIYAFILMVMMKNHIKAGVLDPLVSIGIGLFIGAAFMINSIYQGMCVATAIQASAKQPAVYGKCATAPVIVESFAIFAFVFALLII